MDFDTAKIEIAHNAATHFHKGQQRKYTGEPYVRHPERVADLVRAIGGSTDMICAAYLHDVIEDCGVQYIDIKGVLGAEVASMVLALTKNVYPKGTLRQEWKQAELQRLSKCSPEVKAIKLMDIADNLRDIELADKDYAEMYFKEQVALVNALTLDREVIFDARNYVWNTIWEADMKIRAMKRKEFIF